MSIEWMLIRGSGIVAFALLAAATIWGLLISTKLLARIAKAKPLAWFHESLAIGALLATTVHVVTLSLHDYLEFTWLEILVPGASDWRAGAVSLGIMSFYGLIAVAGSFYVKSHIGHKAWRTIHFASLGVFLAALLHGITSGSDTREPLVAGLYFGSVIVVAALVGMRIDGESLPSGPRAPMISIDGAIPKRSEVD